MAELEKGSQEVFTCMTTILIAVVALFFIFAQIDRIASECQVEWKPVCDKLSGLTLPMLVILLIIGGLTLVISSSAFMLMSKK